MFCIASGLLFSMSICFQPGDTKAQVFPENFSSIQQCLCGLYVFWRKEKMLLRFKISFRCLFHEVKNLSKVEYDESFIELKEASAESFTYFLLEV